MGETALGENIIFREEQHGSGNLSAAATGGGAAFIDRKACASQTGWSKETSGSPEVLAAYRACVEKKQYERENPPPQAASQTVAEPVVVTKTVEVEAPKKSLDTKTIAIIVILVIVVVLGVIFRKKIFKGKKK